MRTLFFIILLSNVAFSDVINGSFEFGQFAQPGDSNFQTFAPGFTGTLVFPGSSILPGWDVALSPFDPDHALTYQPPAAFGLEWTNTQTSGNNGSRWIDLNRGGDLWQVSQVLPTIPGQTYTLTYLGLAGSEMGGATTLVQLIGNGVQLFDDTTLNVGAPFWQPFVHSFVADAQTTTLRFAAEAIGNDRFSGTQIDAVSVIAVPEPSAFLLAAIAVGIIFIARIQSVRKDHQLAVAPRAHLH